MNKKFKIFLASSRELLVDRERFELELGRKSKMWIDLGVFLHLDIWEDLSARMSATRSQDEYNKQVAGCDLFVLLAHTKVGMYTLEEFEKAFGVFKATQKPFIFTYFKETTGTVDPSLQEFKDRLQALGHFYDIFRDTNDLWNRFNKELDRLLVDGFASNDWKTGEKSKETTVNNQGASINTQIVDSNLINPVFHNYGEIKIPKHLGTLPLPPEVFLGREDDLAQVHQKLFGSENVLLLVNGEGGIGKTTFAAKYYHRYAEEYSHMAWVFAEKGLAEALLLLAVPLQVSFEETMPTETRLAELFKVMAELEKPCLLVVDNANSLMDLERNYPVLRSCPNFHVLLTTRITDLPQAAFHPLGTLGREEVVQLFSRHYPAHESHEDELLNQVLKAVGYNTLVIELLAKNLGHFNNRLKKRYPLSQLLADLTEKGLFGISTKEVSTAYQARDLGIRQETPEAILAALYDLGELLEAEQKILSILSVLPAESIGYSILEEILSEVGELDMLLLGLSAKGWLKYNQEKSAFKISPVIQEVVRRKNVDCLWDDCRSLIITLNHKLDYEPGIGHLKYTTYSEATVWVTYAEFTGSTLLEWFQNHLPEEDDLVRLFTKIGSFHKTTGDLPMALIYYQTCEKLSGQLEVAYPLKYRFKNGLAISYERLGTTQSSLGNLNNALGHFHLFNDLELELYNADTQNMEFINNLAISYSKLGDTHRLLGNQKKALKYYKQDLLLTKELYNSNPQNLEFQNHLAISHLKLGETHISLGNLKKALRFYDKYHDLEQELYNSHPKQVSFKNHLANSYSKLGDTRHSQGKLKNALENFKHSNKLLQELFSSHTQNLEFKNNLAVSFERLGDTYSSLGNQEKALQEYENSNKLQQELYHSHPQLISFKNNLAISYQILGWFYENKLSEKCKAKEYFTLSKSLFAELHSAFPDFVEFKDRLDWTEDALRRVE